MCLAYSNVAPHSSNVFILVVYVNYDCMTFLTVVMVTVVIMSFHDRSAVIVLELCC